MIICCEPCVWRTKEKNRKFNLTVTHLEGLLYRSYVFYCTSIKVLQCMCRIETNIKTAYPDHTLYQCSLDHSHSYMPHQLCHRHWLSHHMFHCTGLNIFPRISLHDTLSMYQIQFNCFHLDRFATNVRTFFNLFLWTTFISSCMQET